MIFATPARMSAKCKAMQPAQGTKQSLANIILATRRHLPSKAAVPTQARTKAAPCPPNSSYMPSHPRPPNTQNEPKPPQCAASKRQATHNTLSPPKPTEASRQCEPMPSKRQASRKAAACQRDNNRKAHQLQQYRPHTQNHATNALRINTQLIDFCDAFARVCQA